jgi:hypothetical protein
MAAQAPSERWVLVYTGGPDRPAYTVDDLVHLTAIVDTAGNPVGPLCDGAILLEFHAVSGRYYMPFSNGKPSLGSDWTLYLDSLTAPAGPLTRLDAAAAREIAAKSTNRPISIAVMVPYPDPRTDTLIYDGRRYDVKHDSGRVAVVEAYLRDVVRRVESRQSSNLSLSGFYWLNEAITSPDTTLVSQVAEAVHRLGLRFLWIPYYGAAGAAHWRSFGFDDAWLQPNYFFHPEVSVARLDSAVNRARAADMGLELEFDRRMFADSQFANRLTPYLDTFEKAPDLRSRSIAIYEGAGALIRLARSSDKAHRALYSRLVTVLGSAPRP